MRRVPRGSTGRQTDHSEHLRAQVASIIRTERFDKLYSQVTRDLRAFLVEEQHLQRLSPQCALWFDCLMRLFLNEFGRWPLYAGTAVGEYLALLESPGVHSDFRLAGHAFLHIAYDLPRCIAPTLVTASPMFLISELRTAFVL